MRIAKEGVGEKLKYTVLGFQQEKLIENGLSMEDAFILRTVKDMYSSASMEFKDFDGIKYMWINYTYLMNQIPIVGKKRYLMGRIEAYGKDHLLLRVLEKQRKGQKGNFSYIAPTEKLDSLQDYDPYAQNAQGLCTERISLMHKSPNKDTSISDPSIKDTTIGANEFFNAIWDMYPVKRGRSGVKQTQRIKLYKLGEDVMRKCITNYTRYVEAENKRGFPLQMKNGSTFFNGGYEDYMTTHEQDKPKQSNSDVIIAW